MRTMAVGRGKVQAVAFDPDGGALAVANDRVVRYVPSGGGPSVLVRTGGRSRSLSFAPDGRLAGWEPAGVWVWGGVAAVPAGSPFAPILALAWRDGELFAVRQHVDLGVWDREQFRARLGGVEYWVCAVGHGRHFASIRHGHHARFPDGHNDPVLSTFDLADLPPKPTGAMARGERYRSATPHSRGITPLERPALPCRQASLPTAKAPCVLAVSADGASVLTADGDRRTVRWLDTATGAERAAWVWPVGPIMSLAIAPDGLTAAAGDARGLVVLWDLA